MSIIIPNWNGRELLAEFFPSVVEAAESYRAVTNAEFEIIVIDDASTDDGMEWLHENYGDHALVRPLTNEKNLGFLLTVNRGFEAAKGDLVFLLNNDVKLERDCIRPLTKHFDDPNVFAVCCRAGRVNSERLDGGGKIGRFERGFWRVFLNYETAKEETETELISFYGSGGYTAYDRKKWNELGGFQEVLSPNYWEDVEICYRAWKHGWKVIYEPEAKVKHLGSASMQKKSRTELNITTERNRLLFTWINVHDKRMFAGHLLWLSLKLIGAAVSLNWGNLRAFRAAVSKISKVRVLRRIEKEAAAISDRNIQCKFDEMVNQAGIYIMKTPEDEAAFAALRDSRSM